MRIVVSIPVHEKKEVIKDQVRNIQFYIENPIIVLHVSEGFQKSEKGHFEDLQEMKDVYINPVHYPVKWGDIAHVHISNFVFIKELVGEFDYFLIHASNDMYVKKGIERYIRKYDAGTQRRILRYPKSMWWPCEYSWKDKKLKEIMQKCHVEFPVGTQIEGCFFRKEVFDKAVKYMEDYDSWAEAGYTREEIYFSTVVYGMTAEDKLGYPTTFSEVHRYDSGLWRRERLLYSFCTLPVIRQIISDCTYEQIHRAMVEKYREKACYAICVQDIKKIRSGRKMRLHRNNMKDYPGEYQLYDGNLFSVKRVTRDMDDPVRKYIRRMMNEDIMSQRILEEGS